MSKGVLSLQLVIKTQGAAILVFLKMENVAETRLDCTAHSAQGTREAVTA